MSFVLEASHPASTFGDFELLFKLDISHYLLGYPIVIQVFGGYGFDSCLVPM
jgi:hypothetical protein